MALKLTENSLRILQARYLKKDHRGNCVESPEEMFRRVANHVASAEAIFDPQAKVAEQADTFYHMMAALEFLPNSPTLMNAGRELGQLAACFVLPVGDSLESIFEAVKDTALIHQSGGGTGFSFSHLRPKNAIVSTTSGVASGPVSFMRVFNMATEVIKQGGTRRGANMGILRIDHPDIMEFITAKRDPRELTSFNLSVGITREFMEALEAGGGFELIDPRTGRTFATVEAKEIFDLIVECAWESGEPGVVFLDHINKANPTPHLGRIESTNPCLAGNTWVLTSKGPRYIAQLKGKPADLALNGTFHPTSSKGVFPTGEKEVYEIITNRGYRLHATAEHPVLVAVKKTRYSLRTEWKSISNLKVGDQVVLADHRGLDWGGAGTFEEGYLLGLLVGDGTIKKDTALISVWEDDEGSEGIRERANTFALAMPHRSDFQGFFRIQGRGEWRLKSAALVKLAHRYGLSHLFKGITPMMEATSSEFHRGFIKGLFDCDASVQGSQKKGVSIRLSQSDISTLQASQRMLLRLGISSTIYKNRRTAGFKKMPDGRGGCKVYPVKANHELVVTCDNIVVFADRIGFFHRGKAAHLKDLLVCYRRSLNRERFTGRVVAIVPMGVQRVYDVQIPGVNAFEAEGVVVHNCGEQPLLPFEACNLGSINLVRMIKDNAAGPRIDWAKLGRTVRLAVRFLDNIIEINHYPLPQIEQVSRGNRKIGLGVMGFAHLLILMGKSYDSEEGVDLGEEVMRFIQKEGHEASQELAELRGPFPNFTGSRYALEAKPPLRNATVTTIAPTGTLSIIAGCSSGIEPLFALSYTRRALEDMEIFEIDPIFLRVSKEMGFWRPEWAEALRKTGFLSPEAEIPPHVRQLFITAFEIPPARHIEMQAAFQRHTDNAVSKTINFPPDATKDDVREAFVSAYRMGCKGVTMYRSGTRLGQVLTCGLSQLC